MGQDKFSTRLLRWFDHHGRHTLPWQQNKSLYRVWVSEIMLQQTQVATVIPYYERFMARFPTLESLADSNIDDVLAHWAGLGYYARGRNLHKAANIIMREYAGEFPDDIKNVHALPGIGPSTAGAILSLALDQRHAILDGNVKRSLCRYHGIEGYPGEKAIETILWRLAEKHTPQHRTGDYTQAIMDLGATLCTRSKPNCQACPHHQTCFAFKHDKTKQLPYPRPKRNRPARHCFMLAMLDANNQISLFKRPSTGIWGGLYSLPEFESEKTCLSFIEVGAQNRPHTTEVGLDIKHAFTHFDLTITPIFYQPTEAHSSAPDKALFQQETTHSLGVIFEPETRYFHLLDGNTPDVGVPAPIQKIIDNAHSIPNTDKV